MTAAIPPVVRYVERPRDPAVLLPYMGCQLIALPGTAPPWSGALIALGERAHLRGPNGEIREFTLADTVFAVPQPNR